MTRVSMLVVFLLAFGWLVMAQDQSSASQTTTSTTAMKTHKKSASSDANATDTSAKSSGKSSTVTGCISHEKAANGDYTLTNGRYKNGVDVSGSDDLGKHAGHKVQLTGSWSDPGKAFQETKIKHISETCNVAGTNSASTGADASTATTSSKKSKKSKSSDIATTPKS